ncbi:MAG TPA: acetate--CoA ligase family protein, partial [Candidatus Binatia bacterium]|nr:acetate--CoA ligase family protein [Candidatus Binatia bacterium]
LHYSITPPLQFDAMSAYPVDQTAWRDLTPLMNPRSVAIIGASQRGSSPLNREPRGNRVIRNLRSFGYPGKIFTVNPKYSEVMDCPCYPEIGAIPEPVDCIVLAVPNRHVPDLLDSAANAGVRAAVVFAAGFGETGAEGKQRQARLESLSSERGFLICGPNCYGVLNVFGKAPLFASTIPAGFLAGPVALVSQSGGLSTTIANALMLNRHVGLSHIVSCGNQAGATVEEYFNYFVEDDNTKVIAAFVEGFKQPHKLLEVARKAAARKKPLIILKGGRSEVSQRAAATHSGSLAGAADVIDAAFRQTGIVSVRSLNELMDAASVFSCEPFLKYYNGGRRIGVLSGSGGECTLVSDAASSVGLEVPELTETTKSQLQEAVADFGNMNNPLDGTGAMYDDEKIFPRLLQALIDDANIDVVTINLEANDPRPKELKSGNRFSAAIEKAVATSQKPIACFSSIVGGPVDPEILIPLREAGVPLMEGAECATATIRQLAGYFEFQKNCQRATSAPARRAQRKLPSGILPSEAAFRLFEEFGIQVAPSALTRNPNEAAAAAERLGFPVALKIESTAITHKSDVGGVALRLENSTDVRAAYERIQANVRRHVSDAKVDGVLVQRMAGDGIEMILGVKRDPMFGPVVLCGLGGILVELLKDVSIGIPPLSIDEARAMLNRLRGFAILGGARGKPPADVNALCGAIVGVSHLAVDLGDQLLGLDINPLIVLPKGQGAVAVDAVVEIQ